MSKSLNSSHRGVYTLLSDVFDFGNDDERLWWHSTAPMFAEMLQTANYDIHAQYRHLLIYKKHVIPFLGVYPENGRERWLSILTRYGTPFELSLNCSAPEVRYTFEPISINTGTPTDPFNSQAIWESLQKLITIQPTINLEYFKHFKRDLTLDVQESALLHINALYGQEITTQNKLALDLKGNDFAVKCYIYPALKAIATSRPIHELIFNSVRQLAVKNTAIAASLAMLEDYVTSRGPEGTTAVRLLSCDLIVPSRSRIKIYISEEQVSFETMRDLWTLRGRLRSPSIIAGLEMVKELWDLLQVPAGLRSYPKDFLPLESKPDELLPSMANYTLLPGWEAPEPQVYFTVFGMNDMKVADALTTFFERRGWFEMAAKYKDSLKAYYPDECHETMNYLHAYISFSYRNNKAYLGVYLHTFETGNWSKVNHRLGIPQSSGSVPFQVIKLAEDDNISKEEVVQCIENGS